MQEILRRGKHTGIMCLFMYSCILDFECPMLVFNKGYTVSHEREECGGSKSSCPSQREGRSLTGLKRDWRGLKEGNQT